MYLSKVRLQNWKNFKDTEAVLDQRVFLIGPNASGKSNLLDSLRFLRDVAENGLGQAANARGGVSAIRCLAARSSPSILIDVEIQDDDGNNRWKYTLDFTQDSNKIPRIKSESVVDLSSNKKVLHRPEHEDERDPVRLTQTALEQIVANREFREIADFFRSISYQHLIPQVVRDPKGFSGATVQNDPFGRDMLIRVWKTPFRTRAAWLRRISNVLTDAVPQLQSLEIEMDDQGMPHLVGRYEHWRAQTARQNESQLSDGTLRLFGLMWSMFEGTGPLLLEEPELSLHTEVVRRLPQLLERLQGEIREMKRKADYSKRQLFISTHSWEMLQDRSIAAEEVIIIVPSQEGSTLTSADESDRAAMNAGLSAADVLIPKSAPKIQQLALEFQ